MKLTREVRFAPAFDKRNKDPNKNYGIGAVRFWFIVKGEKGAITVSFGTNWYLPSTIKEYKELGYNKTPETRTDLEKDTETLEAWSWDYHAIEKKHDYQTIMESCEFLDGKPCYCDGSCIRAGEYKEILLEKGSEELFKRLEEDYKIEFENE